MAIFITLNIFDSEQEICSKPSEAIKTKTKTPEILNMVDNGE